MFRETPAYEYDYSLEHVRTFPEVSSPCGHHTPAHHLFRASALWVRQRSIDQKGVAVEGLNPTSDDLHKAGQSLLAYRLPCFVGLILWIGIALVVRLLQYKHILLISGRFDQLFVPGIWLKRALVDFHHVSWTV